MVAELEPALDDRETRIVRTTYRTYIQGLRGISVLAVVAAHAGLPLPGGHTGVDVFFVVSGFVITLGLCCEIKRSGRISIVSFYCRRTLRLLPAFAAMVVGTCLLSLIFASPFGVQQATAKTALAGAVGMSNFVIADVSRGYFGLAAQLNPLLHTWSLSVEEQFYFAFPLLTVFFTWVLCRIRGTRRHYAALVASATVLIALSVGLTWIPVLTGSGWTPSLGKYTFGGYFGILPRLTEFSAGVFLGVWAHTKLPKKSEVVVSTRRKNVHITSLLGLLGAVGLIVGFTFIDSNSRFPVPWAALPLVSTVAIVVAAECGDKSVSNALASKHLCKVGDWSYSIYLWHWPFVVFSRRLGDASWAPVIAVLCSLVPALLSYYYLERKFRPSQSTNEPVQESPGRFDTSRGWLGQRSRRGLPVLVVCCLSVFVAGSGLGVGAQAGWGSHLIRSAQKDYWSKNILATRNCDAMPTVASLASGSCTWNSGSERVAYLLGDSHAGHVSDSVIRQAKNHGYRVTAIAGQGCPLSQSEVYVPQGSSHGNMVACTRFMRETVGWLAQAPTGVVVLAGTDAYWRGPGTGPTGRGKFWSSDSALFQDQTQQLNDLVSQIRQQGHEVAIVQSVPSFSQAPNYFSTANCTIPKLVLDRCNARRMRREYLESHTSVRQAVHDTAVFHGATPLDTVDYLCTPDACATSLHGQRTYRDNNHLTLRGAALLDPMFDEFFRSMN